MATVTRRFFIDLDSGVVSDSLAQRSPLQEIRLKARDATVIGFQMHRGGIAAELLSAGSTLTFGIKAKNDFGGSFLCSATDFTNATTIATDGQSDTDFYSAQLSLNTTPITTALGDTDPEIEAMGELEIDIGGASQMFSSRTLNVIIENDVIRGAEGAPAADGDPEYVSQQEVIRWKSSGSTPAVSSLIGNGSADLDAVPTTSLSAGVLAALINEDSGSVLQFFRLEAGAVTEYAATADAGTDVVTATSHLLSDTDRIQFFTTTTLPAGLSVDTVYFARDTTANTFKVAATSGGAAIDITDTGTGTHTVYPLLDEAEIRPADYDASTNAKSWQKYSNSLSNTEIRDAVEAATDSNTFTDADHTKLNAVEALADVTDATNVAAAGAIMTGTKEITIENPTASEDSTFFYTPVAITITEMVQVVRGTTPSVTPDIRHHTDRSNAGNALITTPSATTNATTGSVISSFNDATIPADSFVWVEMDAVSGTVDECFINVTYTED